MDNDQPGLASSEDGDVVKEFERKKPEQFNEFYCELSSLRKTMRAIIMREKVTVAT